MSTLISALLTFLSSRWTPTGVVLASMVVLYQNALGIMDHVHWVIDQLDGLTSSMGTAPSLSVNVFGLLNYVLPLDLALAQFVLWVPLFLLANSIRFVKSFVPTVAS